MLNDSADVLASVASAKSPMKKARKNKNKKETSPTSSAVSVDEQPQTVVVETTPVAVTKVKAKKDKNNKLKQLKKLDSNSEIGAAESSDDNKVVAEEPNDNCPFKTVVVESAKVKKQRKRDKKAQSAKESQQVDDLASVTSEPKLELENIKETGGKKEKKSRSKKVSSVVEKTSNRDDAQVCNDS